ncbi:FAD-dependent oxidoreductase [Candidatus Dependentiae bacterium]|nr:FAD-dependent oxidoreductase [Candidatus Dependentiae bacterium]
MAKIVIIGAGLTGISAAYHLEKAGFFDYLLVEQEATIGGLCRSVVQDGFTFDYTGHLLHINDLYVDQLLQSFLNKDTFFNHINRRSFVYSHATYTHYPFQVNLHGLPTAVIAECIEGYVQRPAATENPATFYQWVLQNFGEGFARHFFVPYQEKIFASSVHSITASWTGRFVPATTLTQIIAGAIKEPDQNTVGYNAAFLYPREGGTQRWVTAFAEQLLQPIALNKRVVAIDPAKQSIRFADGDSCSYEKIITTIPLPALLQVTNEQATLRVRQAIPYLQASSVVNFNLGIANPLLSDKHWIYFPEPRYPFYRLGFTSNFAASMAPAGCSSLYGEFAHRTTDTATINNLLTTSITQTMQLLDISAEEIITQYIIHIPYAYVLYTPWREKYLPELLATYAQHQIYSVGRYGAWKYSSMQEAILDGKAVVEQLLHTSWQQHHQQQPELSQ